MFTSMCASFPHLIANQVGRMDLVGDVNGCDVIMVDDMIDTAGTLTMAAHELKTMGARRIFAFATHGLFSGAGYERIEKSDLERVIVCNTVPLNPNKQVSERRCRCDMQQDIDMLCHVKSSRMM